MSDGRIDWPPDGLTDGPIDLCLPGGAVCDGLGERPGEAKEVPGLFHRCPGRSVQLPGLQVRDLRGSRPQIWQLAA